MRVHVGWMLMLCLAAAAPAAAQLEVGVARVDVTPSTAGLMYGYGARGTNISTDVHDPLLARALVAFDGRTAIALVTLDLGYVDTRLTKAVRTAVEEAIGLDNVLLMASHTHSGPTFAKDFPTATESYADHLVRLIASAVVEANAARQPARLAVGWGRAEEGHNRRKVLPDGTVEMRWANRNRLPTTPVDYAVGVLAFDTPAGEPIATLVNFACHPVVLGPENLDFSADYPGALMAIVDRQVGGQTMFVQGAAGDINPFWDKTSPTEGAFDEVRRMGEVIAREVIRVRADVTGYEAVPWISLYRDVISLGARWDLDDARVHEVIQADHLEQFRHEREAEINTVLFGPTVAIATFPGEFFVEHGLRFKRQSMVRHTLFVGYTNGYVGYFPTIRSAAEGGYGANSSTIVELGAGERLVSRALINLHFQAGKLGTLP